MDVIVGMVVAVSVGGTNVCVAVADGITNVDMDGNAVASDGLEQPTSKSKIHAGKSLYNFMSDWTEYNILKFHIQF